MNTFGRLFRLSTWGESHGPAVGCVLDGCPSGLELTEADVQCELDRRKPGQSDVTTARGEPDSVEFLSGVFEDRTLGTPVSMLVHNRDADSSKYRDFIYKPRPGHADLAWRMKYGHVDWRGGGRSSARETVGRVAGGAVAKKILQKHRVQVVAYTKQIGRVKSGEVLDSSMKGVADLIESNPVRALDVDVARSMVDEVKVARKKGDSVGGVVECVALNVPPGLGEPVFGKLTADLAAGVASIPGVKGVEFGLGFDSASKPGSEVNDEFTYAGGVVRTTSNNSGGIQGGITNGMPVVLRAAFKPTSSIKKRQHTVDLNLKKNSYIQVEGRHDPCIVPRAVPVVEAMVNLVLADHMIISGNIPRKL
ncbi:MAG: chorismate synthase [Candidatus Altiarchaeales archaeon]|nr:chorismate synthase [Candidatus Altiarchaeales archaeon]MBD3416646.1 chorismate synthase [Candidatus Altiarchaeales archaeon]